MRKCLNMPKHKQAYIWASKQTCVACMRAYTVHICMHMYGATVHESTNAHADTQEQFSSLAWPCELVELCDVNVLWHSLQACKIKQGLPQEEPYILKLWFPLLHIRQDVESCCLRHSLTHTHTDIYTMLCHWKCRLCIMYPCFCHTEQHVLVSSQSCRYYLDTRSVFTLFFISFSFCLSLCILSYRFVLKSSSVLCPTFTDFSVFALRAIVAHSHTCMTAQAYRICTNKYSGWSNQS